MNASPEKAGPWYREPWPWLLMIAPGAAVLGCAAILWIAVTTADGLVADDYYRQGLAINQRIARYAQAAELDLRAQVELDPAARTVVVRLEGRGGAPQTLVLQLAHTTRAGHDVRLPLARTAGHEHGGASYASSLPPLAAGRWRVALEDAGRGWRLAGDWTGEAAQLALVPGGVR